MSYWQDISILWALLVDVHGSIRMYCALVHFIGQNP